jgi:ribose 5-phosphate isomerase A
VTDNGNIILDVKGMVSPMPRLWKPASTASWGVVTNGLFAHRGADVVLIGTPEGVIT